MYNQVSIMNMKFFIIQSKIYEMMKQTVTFKLITLITLICNIRYRFDLIAFQTNNFSNQQV